jgi:hypothetical protein
MCEYEKRYVWVRNMIVETANGDNCKLDLLMKFANGNLPTTEEFELALNKALEQ